MASRSQAESYIRLGIVLVNGRVAVKSGQIVSGQDKIEVKIDTQYVSRAALKLKSADQAFAVDWKDKTVLDVGSSTGGFTQYALQHGARCVVAVDVGSDQLHPSLRNDPRIELHEKTDIRNVRIKTIGPNAVTSNVCSIDHRIDIVVADVSFISLRDILPHVSTLMSKDSILIAMVKPQFEAGNSHLKHKGVIKNDKVRREILKEFEVWAQRSFKLLDKTDSAVAGSKGNLERFYLLRKLPGTKAASR